MINYQQKIAFWGMGLENIALAEYLLDKGLLEEVAYVDSDDLSLNFAVKKIQESELNQYSLVFKSPGICSYSPEVLSLKEQGVKILSPNQVFFENNQSCKIAVTGSKGKSTLVKLLECLFRACGIQSECAGNIGRPLTSLIEVQADVFIIELSSYQLHDLQDMQIDVAAITALFPEHLNWHLNLDNYYRDKLKIFDFADRHYFFPEDKENINTYSNSKDLLNSYQSGFAEQFSLINTKFSFVPHLRQVLDFALSILNDFLLKQGLQLKSFQQELEAAILAFEFLPHRLEEVKIKEVECRLINDSISTAPESVIAGVKSFPNQKLALILGGQDRGVSQDKLIEFLIKNPVQYLYLLPETSSYFHEHNNLAAEIVSCQTINEAVQLAVKRQNDFDVLLFSPGAASYHMFKNFEERGKEFKSCLYSHFCEV